MNKTQIFFLVAIIANAVYLVITFVFFYFLDSFLMNIDTNDYLSFYNAGLIVIDELPNLYNSSLYLFPFTYLPLSAYFFVPFSLLGLKSGYFAFQLFNFFLNVFNLYLIYKIIKLYQNVNQEANLSFNYTNLKDVFIKPENESILHHNAIYLIMLPQFMNYFLGQINILVLFFTLASLFFFLKGKNKFDLLGGFMLGCGILFKPTLVLILPFIIILSFDKKTKKWTFEIKQTISRLICPLILILISISFFLFFPNMLTDFIEVNLAGRYTYNLGGELEINPSFSLTRILLILLDLLGLNVNGFLVFFVLLLIFLLPIYYFFVLSQSESHKLVIGYLSGYLIMLIVYFDSWPHHIVVLTPLLIFFIIFNAKFKNIRIVKLIHYLVAILIVAFWGIFYLTYEFLPLNLGGSILLLLLYYYLVIYYANKAKENLEKDL
ncbi:MAG: glycosyltransferase 87 family protein [Promethearchaeota archaeon]|jgi:hypothetical protein